VRFSQRFHELWGRDVGTRSDIGRRCFGESKAATSRSTPKHLPLPARLRVGVGRRIFMGNP
jgi:hypothetical protein